jgi:hypothetical protein
MPILVNPATAYRIACIDASESMEAGPLPARTIRAIADKAGSWARPSEHVLTTKAADAVPGLDLKVRVVRANSFKTGLDADTAEVKIPGARGIDGPGPRTDDLERASHLGLYTDQVKVVEADRALLLKEQSNAPGHVLPLERRNSDGSDITGCLSALVEMESGMGPVKALVVSDLKDTKLTDSDGSKRKFLSRLDNVDVTIVQTCPSGSPEDCARALENFLDRLTPLGLERKRVHVVRAEDVSEAVDQWLRG